ncbi:serine protease snake-like [Leptidea sinapis]|uniref:serine protease snake-like n=1 Tax=Leptidea sinapis TaxID=189913 RepID=UPI00212DAB63|nr:serine protease snake-like [Leptidea sinapis]
MIINKLLFLGFIEVIAGSDYIPKHSYKLQTIESGRMKRDSNDGNTTNPCTPYDPPMPNFYEKASRVSEEKCFEYIWKLKVRADVEKRRWDCVIWRHHNSDENGPHSAIGGRNTEPGEFPHMGALGWRAIAGTWIFKCGSTLISENYLLTAAHCSQTSSGDTTVADTRPEIVRLGDKNIVDVFYNGQKPLDVKIKRIVNHPNFKPPKKYFDIAIVELARSVIFTKYIQPACLWSDFDTTRLGAQATLTGWGVIETAGRKTSPELQAAVVDIIDSGLCDRLLRPSCNRHWCGLESHQICAGKLAGGVDACQGDSGGPLQVKIPLPIISQGSMHYIIGVTSFGIGCARPNLPGVYTRVSNFVDWIEDIVWRGL